MCSCSGDIHPLSLYVRELRIVGKILYITFFINNTFPGEENKTILNSNTQT